MKSSRISPSQRSAPAAPAPGQPAALRVRHPGSGVGRRPLGFLRNLPIALGVNLGLALGLALVLFTAPLTGIGGIAMATILVANALGLLLAASRRLPWFRLRRRSAAGTRELLAAHRTLKARADALETIAWDRAEEVRETNHLLQREMIARRQERLRADQAAATTSTFRLELIAIAAQLQQHTAPDSAALPHLIRLQAKLQGSPQAPAKATTQPDSAGVRKVLVVDDEPAILETVTTMLEHLGLEVITARDGLEAMACFNAQSDQLSLVLLDLAMPRMDGQQTFLAMRALETELPIIISSGHDARQRLRPVEGPGRPTFLQKPYSLSRLQESVEQALGLQIIPTGAATRY